MKLWKDVACSPPPGLPGEVRFYDPDARLYKKSYGKESKLSSLGHVLVENCNGLIAAAMATQDDGHAERDAALLMLQRRQKSRLRRITVGADKAYDTQDFVATARELNVTVHVQQNNSGRRSRIDRREHPASRLCPLASPPMAGREDLRLAQGDRTTSSGQAARPAQGGLDFVFSCAARSLLRLPRLPRLPRLLATQASQHLQPKCA